MNKLGVILSFATIFLLTTSVHGQTWKIFHSEEGGFSILTPGLMEEKSATVNTEIGEFDVHTLFLNPKDTLGNYLYLINYYDLPEGMVPDDSTALVNDFLTNTMDQSVTDVNGSLLYNTPVEIGIHTGLMWRASSDSGTIKCRAYIINNRFYMLQVFSYPRKSLNKEIDRFLESFTLKS